MHCRHHPTCPGCPLLDRPLQAQLDLKRTRLGAALAAFPHLPPAPVVQAATRQEGYRHRLKLPVDARAGYARIGLYGANGDVLDTPDCPVLAQPLQAALATLRELLAGHHEIHAIDLRVSDATGGLQLVIACEGGSLKGGKTTVRRLQAALPSLHSMALSVADPARKRVMGRKPTVVAGEPWLEEQIGPARYRLLPGAFFQADPQNAVALHTIVRRFVGEADTVLDLYAGVGSYALALAPGRRRVVAVEEVPQAAAAARAMAPPNVEVVTSKVEDLDLREPFDVVILNPARRGSDPATLARLPKIARRVIYVSCGPETFARDLDALAAHGLHVDQLAAIDLFPQTAEVEAVAHLVPGPPRRRFQVAGGQATPPWFDGISGAVGRPTAVIALVIGDPGPHGNLPGGRFTRIGVIATHALIGIDLEGPPGPALAALARRGHPTAGRDPRTANFFAEKAGLIRPFEHVLRAGPVRAPLHGDLALALRALGANAELLRRAGASG